MYHYRVIAYHTKQLLTVKWESIERQPNVFNFTAADEIVQFAESVNSMVRGHTIEW